MLICLDHIYDKVNGQSRVSKFKVTGWKRSIFGFRCTLWDDYTFWIARGQHQTCIHTI